MATLDSLRFGTSAFTGTAKKQSIGQDLAGLLTQGLKTYAKVQEVDRAVEARTDKENQNRDYIKSINESTNRNQWEVDTDYSSQDSGTREELDTGYYKDNPSDYDTEVYQATHESKISARQVHNSKLQRKEAVAALDSSSSSIAEMRVGDTYSEEMMQTDLDQFRQLDPNYKTIDFTRKLTTSTLNRYLGNRQKYLDMSGEDFEKEFAHTSLIKDKTLQAKFTSMRDDKYVHDAVVKGGFFKSGERAALNKKVIGLEGKAKKYANTIVPGMLAGDDASVQQGINIVRKFNLDHKLVIAENTQRMARYDLSLYTATKDVIDYDEDTMLKVSGIELVGAKNNIDVSTEEGFQEMQAIYKANKGTTADLGGESPKDVLTEEIDGDGADAEWIFKKRHYKAALLMGNDKKEVFDILENLWVKSSVEDLPVKYAGIKNEDELDEFTEYLSDVAIGQTGAKITVNGTGFTVTRLEGNRTVNQFYDRAGLKHAVADYKKKKSNDEVMKEATLVLTKPGQGPRRKGAKFVEKEDTMDQAKGKQLASSINAELVRLRGPDHETEDIYGNLKSEVLFNVGQMSNRASNVKLTKTQVDEANTHLDKAIQNIGHGDNIKAIMLRLGTEDSVNSTVFKTHARKVLTGLYSVTADRLSKREEQIDNGLEMNTALLVELASMELGGEDAVVARNVTSEYAPEFRKEFEREVYSQYEQDIIIARPMDKKNAFARALVDVKQDRINNLKAFLLQKGPTDRNSLERIENLFTQINGYNTEGAMRREIDVAQFQLFKEKFNVK